MDLKRHQYSNKFFKGWHCLLLIVSNFIKNIVYICLIWFMEVKWGCLVTSKSKLNIGDSKKIRESWITENDNSSICYSSNRNVHNKNTYI